jgi:flagellar biogenesis protein FliO
MKIKNNSAGKRSSGAAVPCAVLLLTILLLPVVAADDPRHAAAATLTDDPPPSFETIVRPRRTQRIADHEVANDRSESKTTRASAFKPTLTDELVRPAQFVTTDDSSEASEVPAASIESSSRRGEASDATPTGGSAPLKLAKKKDRSSADPKKPRPSPEQSLRTIGGSLAVVIALVLGMALLFRKVQPKGAGALPLEVIEVLGRSTLTKGQNLQLVRIGGKLVLLCVTAHGSETLTEINDADEVERLATLCRQSGPKSVSAAFRDVLAQVGSDAVTGGFVGTPEQSAGNPARPTSWWQQQYS